MTRRGRETYMEIESSHVIVVRVSHLETSTPSRGAARIPIASNILEGVTSSPLAGVTSGIALHGVCSRKVVPRPDEMDHIHRGMRSST